jgi:hypothetical protein
MVQKPMSTARYASWEEASLALTSGDDLAPVLDRQERAKAAESDVTDDMLLAEFMPRLVVALDRCRDELRARVGERWWWHSLGIPLSTRFSNGLSYRNYFRQHPEKWARVNAAAAGRGWELSSGDIPWAPYGNDNAGIECRLKSGAPGWSSCKVALVVFALLVLLVSSFRNA